MQPLIELRNVWFAFGSQPALEDVHLHLHPGQCVALVGPSGAGKTTLLKLVLGTLQPTRGHIHLRTPSGMRPRIGYVPQRDTIDWNFPVTVEQLVWMGLAPSGSPWPWPTRDERRRVAAMLERLDIGTHAKHHIRDLSGGEQQRVFLARAMLAEPDLLVLDEPTRGIDLHAAEAVLHMLAEWNRQGISVLMSSHDLNAVAAHVPWAVCLNRRVIAQGPPDEVFTEDTLNATFRGDLSVLRQDGRLLIQHRPHHHGVRDLMPNPVPGDVPPPSESTHGHPD